jgi:hypothetical protein
MTAEATVLLPQPPWPQVLPAVSVARCGLFGCLLANQTLLAKAIFVSHLMHVHMALNSDYEKPHETIKGNLQY